MNAQMYCIIFSFTFVKQINPTNGYKNFFFLLAHQMHYAQLTYFTKKQHDVVIVDRKHSVTMIRPTHHDTMFLCYKYYDVMPWLYYCPQLTPFIKNIFSCHSLDFQESMR